MHILAWRVCVYACMNLCVCVLVDAASDICLAYSFLLREVTAGQPVHPSSYRNWLLTDTLQADLQLKDPTGHSPAVPELLLLPQ